MMSDDRSLVARFESRTATIGVVGLGYVGLPLSLEFTDVGFDVSGFDIDERRVDRLLAGDSYVDDVGDDELEAGLDDGFEAASDPKILAGADAFVIAVPTGFDRGNPSMDAVEAAASTIADQQRGEALVVVTSTVYPGATRNVVAPIVAGSDGEGSVHVAMVPERLNPGGDVQFTDIPLVTGANTLPARRATATLFDTVVSEVHKVDSTETAELSKTLENTYRTVNIALVNELVEFAEATGMDLWGAIEAAETKPFGFQAFRPGPGVGGHCIPVDSRFLTWCAEQQGTELSLIGNANRVNSSMPSTVVDRFETALVARGFDPGDTSIVALGASYKKNVGDVRNSPALKIIEELSGDVTAIDPHVDREDVPAPLVRRKNDNSTVFQSADAAIVLVNHDSFDLTTVVNSVPFVFDTRAVVPRTGSADVLILGELAAGLNPVTTSS